MSLYTDELISMVLSSAEGMLYWDSLPIRNEDPIANKEYYGLNDWICDICGFIEYYRGKDWTGYILKNMIERGLA